MQTIDDKHIPMIKFATNMREHMALQYCSFPTFLLFRLVLKSDRRWHCTSDDHLHNTYIIFILVIIGDSLHYNKQTTPI